MKNGRSKYTNFWDNLTGLEKVPKLRGLEKVPKATPPPKKSTLCFDSSNVYQCFCRYEHSQSQMVKHPKHFRETASKYNKTGTSQVGAISKAQKFSRNVYWKHLEKFFFKKVFG